MAGFLKVIALCGLACVASLDLFVPAEQKEEAAKQAQSLPAIEISEVDRQWVQVLAEGWAAPLKGFMTEQQYLECLHFEHLVVNGELVSMPVPIVLPVQEEDKQRVGDAEKIALKFGGKLVAVLSNPTFFEHRKEERAARTFGIAPDAGHPYIKMILDAGEFLLGGDLVVFDDFVQADGMDQFRKTPAQLQARWQELGADAVFVFQLRNPVHNGHALLMQDTARKLKEQGFKKPVLWLSPLGGWTKEDDVPLDVRMKQHHAIIKNGIFGDVHVELAIFPSPMLYGGPREVQWHAKSRLTAGATHYIVGRDPAGMKHPTKNAGQPMLGDDLYHMWHGQMMLGAAPGLQKLKLLPFKFASYDKTVSRMAFFDPARKDDFISISGTKMRKLARSGEQPPVGFMDPEGWQILVDFYQGKSKQEL